MSFFTKINSCYNKLASFLTSFSADKYVHCLAGIIISMICTACAFKIWDADIFSSVLIGIIAAAGISIIKEIIDRLRAQIFDGSDIAAGTIGGFLGALLSLMFLI